MDCRIDRASDGTVNFGEGVTAKIPEDRSMLSVFGSNAVVVAGSEYRNDGWVYVDGKKVKKWFISVGRNRRIWEPGLADLKALYQRYRRFKDHSDRQWSIVTSILQEIWDTRADGDNVAIVHCVPTHKFTWHKDTQPWWVYRVHPYQERYDYFPEKGLCFGFAGLDEKPETVVHRELGEALYGHAMHAADTSERWGRAKDVLVEAMLRSLPVPTKDRVMCLNFGEESFWFRTVLHASDYRTWDLLLDGYQFDVTNIDV